MLYRVFPHHAGTRPDPLAVPRHLQGAGRHDNPEHYTCLYLGREPVSVVAERIQGFRGKQLTEAVFNRPDGRTETLASIDDSAWPGLVDLDDPAVLAAASIRPSQVATRERRITQAMALRFFEAGDVGLSWWSTLESAWTNVSAFAERVAGEARLVDVEPLSIDHPVVREAADFLLIDIASPSGRRRRLT